MTYQFEQLPQEIRRQVEDYIEFLLQKYKSNRDPGSPASNPRLSAFGLYEGKIKISKDFDEPLDDFSEYM